MSGLKNLLDFPNIRGDVRVCLPYGINILDIGRWFFVDESINLRHFEFIAGSIRELWTGDDVIDLFIGIKRHCIGYSLADSFVVDHDTDSVLGLDRHERFSSFSSKEEILEKLFPFSREVMWENFSLIQEPDVDQPLSEIFAMVHNKE